MAQIWCTVMDKLQYLLYKKQELAPNGILPDGLGALLNEAGRRGVIAAGAIGQTGPRHFAGSYANVSSNRSDSFGALWPARCNNRLSNGMLSIGRALWR